VNYREVISLPEIGGSGPEVFTFRRCLNCGVMFLAVRPPASEMARYYRDDYEPYQNTYHPIAEAFVGWRTKKEGKMLLKYCPSAKDLLDVGASWGKYIKAMRDRLNFKVVGVEPNSAMCAEGKRRGLDLRAGELLAQKFPDQSFDILVMNHVIEHLSSPRKEVREIFRILRPGGLALLRTPNEDTPERHFFGRAWLAYEFPRHLILFNRETLSRLLEKEGFEVIKVWFEKTPNDIILSIKNFGQLKKWPLKLTKFFDINNLFLLCLFQPIALLSGLFSKTGRMVILAKKKSR